MDKEKKKSLVLGSRMFCVYLDQLSDGSVERSSEEPKISPMLRYLVKAARFCSTKSKEHDKFMIRLTVNSFQMLLSHESL